MSAPFLPGMGPTGDAMSSAAGSRARTSVTRGRGPASPGSGRASGTSSPVSFAFWHPESSSWRTCQRCLLGGWIAFSGRWPRSGTTRNGTASRLPPLVPSISGTACSFWPTPTLSAHNLYSTTLDSRDPKERGGGAFALVDAARMWPTPSATLGTHAGLVTPAKAREGGTLVEAVSGGSFAESMSDVMFPTPTANDAKNSTLPPSQRGRDSLVASVMETTSGQLNPTWVEWLMGFPIGWTDCGDSGMPSSPR